MLYFYNSRRGSSGARDARRIAIIFLYGSSAVCDFVNRINHLRGKGGQGNRRPSRRRAHPGERAFRPLGRVQVAVLQVAVVDP